MRINGNQPYGSIKSERSWFVSRPGYRRGFRYNDVLMFSKSGYSIAMGNSSDEVKAQASVVTDSNEDEGFANAVRKFVLCRVAA